ncbi:MAG: hypothetical protein N4A50_14365 [Vallitalea sp.]|jgi:DNA-directed RNA polymerase subunit M/transcription elongation factor TFIIS|nr:hypothetical protein [Vallitalea sp.]
MARRKPYSKLVRENKIIAPHVKGMGDVVFRQFQCLNHCCQNIIIVKEDDIKDDFDIECPACGFHHIDGEETKFFDYRMEVTSENVTSTVENGEFTIYHEEYIESSMRCKYCIICNALKTLDEFDNHSSRKSKKQGECRQCKKIYNSIKNGTRTSDQHRESGQKRRLLLDIANMKVNSKEVYKNYDYTCFACGADLSEVTTAKERPLDHTLPVFYLWPLTTKSATLLCRTCNGQKSGAWPSDFYSIQQLKLLSIKTGIDYTILSGKPKYNPDAIAKLSNTEFVDALLVKYTKYMADTIIPLRNRLIRDINFDFFEYSNIISQDWIDYANKQLKR